MHGSRSFETTLLVEDEFYALKMTALVLRRLGYRVQEASSGEDALLLAERSREKIDLLMTDVLMPGMNGRELADLLLARDASLKVLFLSGQTEDMVARQGIVHTNVAFLQKPFAIDVLSEKLKHVLDRR
jgi:two-component system, cell cycle sensor histidine kinase and response regulator CckA